MAGRLADVERQCVQPTQADGQASHPSASSPLRADQSCADFCGLGAPGHRRASARDWAGIKAAACPAVQIGRIGAPGFEKQSMDIKIAPEFRNQYAPARRARFAKVAKSSKGAGSFRSNTPASAMVGGRTGVFGSRIARGWQEFPDTASREPWATPHRSAEEFSEAAIAGVFGSRIACARRQGLAI